MTAERQERGREREWGRDRNPEEQILVREGGGSSLVAYAAVKYFSYVIMVVAVLYFLGRWVLPILVQ